MAILLVTLNGSVVLIIFLNPKPIKEMNKREEPQKLVQQDLLLNKFYRKKAVKYLR